MDESFLSQGLVGEWAGDRLIITGDYSDYSPFPPLGEWKQGNLYNLVSDESGPFSDSHVEEAYQYYQMYKKSITKKLEKLYDGQIHMMVNLDKKEYLDPRAYGQKNVTDFTETNGGKMADLVLSLIHSTGCGGGDLKATDSKSRWAGDRIVICSPEQLEIEEYTNVSDQNVDDLENS